MVDDGNAMDSEQSHEVGPRKGRQLRRLSHPHPPQANLFDEPKAEQRWAHVGLGRTGRNGNRDLNLYASNAHAES